MPSIGSAVVDIYADTSKFKGSVAKGTKGAFTEVEKNATTSGKIVGSNMATGAEQQAPLWKRFAGGVVATTGKVLKTGAIGVGVAAGAGLGYALTKGMGRLVAIDSAQKKLEGLGHSAGEVKNIMNNALTAVKGTAFGLDEAATVAASAVAAGIKPGRELTKTLTLVGDAATIGGTSMADMGLIFNKVAASNKLQGDTINQLNEKGIPILQFLAKTMHKSQAEVSDLASKGKIDFKTFQTAMEQGLGGAAKKSGDSFVGAMANIKASMGRIGANLLGGIFPALAPSITRVTKAMEPLEAGAGAIGEKIGKLLVPALNWLVSGFEKVTAGAQVFFSKLDFSSWGAFVNSAKSVGGGALSGVGKAFGTIADSAKVLWPAIKDLVSQLPKLGGAAATGAAAGIKILAAVLGFVADHIDIVVKLLPAIIAGYIAWRAVTATTAAAQSKLVAVQTLMTPVTLANNILRLTAISLERKHAIATGQYTKAMEISRISTLKSIAIEKAKNIAILAGAAASKIAAGGLRLVGLAMKFALGPVGLIITAIGLLVTGFILAYKKSETFRNIVNGALNGVKKAAQAVVGFFTDHVLPVFSSIGDVFTKHVLPVLGKAGDVFKKLFTGDVVGAAKSYVGYLTTAFTEAGKGAKKLGEVLLTKGGDMIDGLISGAEAAVPKLTDWFTALPGRVKDAAGNAATWLIEKGKAVVSGLIDGAKKAGPVIVNWVKSLPGKIKSGIADAGSWLKDNGGKIIGGLVKGLKIAVPVLLGFFIGLPVLLVAALVGAAAVLVYAGAVLIGTLAKGIASAIGAKLQPVFSKFGGWIASTFATAWNKVTGILLAPVEAGRKAVTGAIGKIKSSFSGATTWVGSTWHKGWSKVSGWISGAVNNGKNAVAKAWDKTSGIRQKFSSATAWAGSTWKKGWAGVKAWITDPVGSAKNTTSKLMDATSGIRSKFNSLKTWAGSTWKKGWSSVKGWISNAVQDGRDAVARNMDNNNGIRSKFSALKSWTGSTWRKGWNSAKSWIADPIGKGKDLIRTQLGPGGKVRGILNGVDSWGRHTFGPNWGKMKHTLSKPVTGAYNYFKSVFAKKGGGIRKVLTDFVHAAGAILSKLGHVLVAPINGVIKVLNLGLIKGAINFVLGKLGAKGIPWITPIKMATGGIPFKNRYTPGKDIGTVQVSGYESVMRPEFTRAAGEGWVNQANAAARNGGVGGAKRFLAEQSYGAFASGGIVKPTKSGRQNASYAGHSGIDFFGNVGDPILAATAGHITYVGSGRGYGNAIFETSDKGVQMVYGHSSAQSVKNGQEVKAGQVIGKVGYSGNVRPPGPAGAHLHFEIAPGGRFALAGNRASTEKWLGGSGLVGKIIGAVSGALDFMKGLDPVKWFANKAATVGSSIAKLGGGMWGQGLAKIPGFLMSKAKDWINENVTAAASTDDVTAGATWQGGKVSNWNSAQLNNAATIVKVAKQLGFGDKGALIGLMTAMQESTLNNLSGGDRDSVGLFQQRAPWGSFSDRHNPPVAASMFFNGGHGGQPGLRSKPWRTMSPGAAAQAVQVSAFPDAYNKWQASAQALVNKYDNGGWLPTGTSINVNKTGRREPQAVFTQEQWSILQALADSKGSGGPRKGDTIVIEVEGTPLTGTVRKVISNEARKARTKT